MKEKKADKKIAKEVLGDPAFYNDQIDANNVPGNDITGDKKSSKSQKAH